MDSMGMEVDGLVAGHKAYFPISISQSLQLMQVAGKSIVQQLMHNI